MHWEYLAWFGVVIGPLLIWVYAYILWLKRPSHKKRLEHRGRGKLGRCNNA